MPDPSGPPIGIIVLLVALLGSNGFWIYRQSHAGRGYVSGMEKFHKKDYPGAIQDLESALGQNPDDPLARFGLGWAYQTSGRPADAAGHYLRSISVMEEYLGYSLNNLQFILNSSNPAQATQLGRKRVVLQQMKDLKLGP